MKRRTIIALIVAALLIITGGLILVLGLSFAGSSEQPSVLTKQEVLISETFHSMVIDTADCDVSFVVYNGEADAHVTIMEQKNVSHSVVVEDGILKIEMIDNRRWTDHISIYNVYGKSENMEMTVYLPNAHYDSIRITTDTGDVKVPGILAAKEVLLRSDTGDVWLEGGPVEMLDCMVSTGDIMVRGGEAKFMKLRTDTGDLDIGGLTGEELHLASDTGDTEVENVEMIIFTFNGSSGDVELDGMRVEEYLQIHTSTGEIDVHDSNVPVTVNIATSTGDITVPEAWGFQCIVTDTGGIRFE